MPTSRLLVGDEGGLTDVRNCVDIQVESLGVSKSLVEGHAADLSEHLNLERGDTEAIRIAFGREVARRNRVCTKGRAKGLECSNTRSEFVREGLTNTSMSSVARTWP